MAVQREDDVPKRVRRLVAVKARTRRRAIPHRRSAASSILFPGLDVDRLGVHLLECRSYELAAWCFRRAIGLNPAEPHFRVHLAHCLYQQRQYSEAVQVLTEVLRIVPVFAPATTLLEWCAQRLADAANPLDEGSGRSETEPGRAVP